ncbi:dehydrogenase [Mycolicibacterium setense]|uniref:SDR family NAD(P)-dependent oxidoreductase n=1 Tax=Mycolicibacterium setense TaxID=431269 RepID=UPI0007E9F3D5|nr:SDR family NAD(P)-dependent oxidoreductase [Mycolicibacterium setense]OBB17669.1 dehydrogenase [Mycolicibacterium setense]
MSAAPKKKEPLRGELIVVTGTSTGIGRATAQELARRGFHVLAGVRREVDADGIRGTNLEPVMLDITNEDHIAALVQRVATDREKRPLRALINNAAIEMNTPIETLPLSEWRRQFEVNVFGQVAMTQALLPALFESKGTVINISSIGGKAAMGCYGTYASTKAALEAISDALRRETAHLGLTVIVVEPGAVTSPMSLKVREKGELFVREMTADQRRRYAGMMEAMMGQAESYIDKAVSAEKAGETIADALMAKKPRTRYTIGNDARSLAMVLRFLPDRLVDKLIARSMRPYFPAGSK